MESLGLLLVRSDGRMDKVYRKWQRCGFCLIRWLIEEEWPEISSRNPYESANHGDRARRAPGASAGETCAPQWEPRSRLPRASRYRRRTAPPGSRWRNGRILRKLEAPFFAGLDANRWPHGLREFFRRAATKFRGLRIGRGIGSGRHGNRLQGLGQG